MEFICESSNQHLSSECSVLVLLYLHVYELQINKQSVQSDCQLQRVSVVIVTQEDYQLADIDTHKIVFYVCFDMIVVSG